MADYAKLQTICGKTYKEQAVWFLNCFWEEFASKEAELLWQYVLKNEELDLEFHKEGTSLDEMKAHVFLERFDETLTVREMRDKLRATGAIGENERPKTVPLTHYLLYKYNVDWRVLIDKTRQGDNKEEMAKAESLLAEVQAAFQDSENKAAAARRALIEAQNSENAAILRENEAKDSEAQALASENEAKRKEEEAKQREAEAVASEERAVVAETQAKQREAEAFASEEQAVQRETEARASEEQAKKVEAAARKSEEQAKQRETDANVSATEAQSRDAVAQKDAETAKAAENDAQAAKRELEDALRELRAQEDAYNQRVKDLTDKGNDESIGVVSRNKAKAELAQLKAEDPLPLRRAKITVEAAIRKADKATTIAAETANAAAASATASSKARAQAENDASLASAARRNAEDDAARATTARKSAEEDATRASVARKN